MAQANNTEKLNAKTPEQVMEFRLMMATYQESSARQSIKDHLKDMKSVFERGALEMQRYLDQIEGVEPGTNGVQGPTIEELYSWALNEVENRVRNLNTSNAVGNSTRYVSAKEQLKLIQEIQAAK